MRYVNIISAKNGGSGTKMIQKLPSVGARHMRRGQARVGRIVNPEKGRYYPPLYYREEDNFQFFLMLGFRIKIAV